MQTINFDEPNKNLFFEIFISFQLRLLFITF